MEYFAVVITIIIIALIFLIVVSQQYCYGDIKCGSTSSRKRCTFFKEFMESFGFLLLIIILFCPCVTWGVLLIIALVIILSAMDFYQPCVQEEKRRKVPDYMIEDD